MAVNENTEAIDKGKAPIEEPQGVGPSTQTVKVSTDDGNEPDNGFESDLQLAWENLETARAIWSRNAQASAPELASKYIFFSCSPPSLLIMLLM